MKCRHHSNCNEIAAKGRLYLCIKHRDEHAEEKMRLQNERGTARKRAWRAANPVLCREPGCTNPVEMNKHHRCPECKEKLATLNAMPVKRSKLWDHEDNEATKASKPAKPVPRKKFKAIMTDAEQEQINREVSRFSWQARQGVNQTMLMQRMMRRAIVSQFDTGYSQPQPQSYQPPKKTLPYVTEHACTWD